MTQPNSTARKLGRFDRLVQIRLNWERCAEEYGADSATATMACALYETEVERDAARERAESAEEALDVWEGRAGSAEEKLRTIRALVDEQAEDEALWALNLDGTLSISEAYLQQELRRLHALIEANGA